TVAAAQTPTISSINPSSPIASGADQNVTVNGNNFQNGMTVTIFFPGGGSGTLSGTQLQNVTPTSFRMVVTLNIVGTYGIRINNPSGLQSSTFNFNVQAAAPSITSINPTSPCVRNNDQNITVNGSNFVSGLTVTVFFPTGGTTTLSGSQIQSVTSTSFVMVITTNLQGNYGIRVNNPGGAQSNTFNFSTQNCVSISSISPATPTVGNTDQSIVVNGSGFVTGMTVTVFFPGGGTATLSGSQIGSVSSTSFTMFVTLNVLGTYGIRVNNPNGNFSNTFNFSTQAASPTISSINPASPCVNGNDQNVTVSGSNFVSGLTVTVFLPAGGPVTLSGSQIQSVTSTSFVMVITLNLQGNYGIRVNNPSGAQSNTFNFTTQHCVSISSIAPSTPTVNNSDQNIVVNGTGFVSGLTVTVFIPGGTQVTLSGTQIQSVSSTSFTMTITLNVVGTYGIRVNNPNGNLSNTFSFNTQAAAPPVVNSVNPSSPTANPIDQNIAVNGSNYQQGLTVTVTFPNGGTATLGGTQIQNVTSSSFVMRITLASAGTWCIRVNNPNGGQSSTFCFTVQSGVQSATIYSINPATPIARTTDQDVIVSGGNFQENLVVDITFPAGGGTTLSGSQIQNVSSSSFIMRATLNAAGNWTIKVRNPDGGQSNIFGFTVTNGTSTSISSINPSSPLTNGADQNVTVNGSNFQSNLRVNVTFPSGGMATLQGTGQIQNVTAGSFLMRITLNAPGSWTIRVINPDNSQSQQFAFTVQPSGPPPTGLPTSVLSPVIGPLRVTTSNQGINDGKWEFNQHGTDFHTPTGGISLSNDRYAWDSNLYLPTNGNGDAGKAVFATAPGQVVKFVGLNPGDGPGAVLVAHPNANTPAWFSGYLHLRNVRVNVDQFVNQATVLGDVGNVGANNDHLHFVLYSGSNSRGNLSSFNATIEERTNAYGEISSIVPNEVARSSDLQSIVINGSGFPTDPLIEVTDRNGRKFTVVPETSLGARAGERITNISPTAITARVAFGMEGRYEFAVVSRTPNSGSSASTTHSQNIVDNNIVTANPGPPRTPIVVIPGMMGSVLKMRIPLFPDHELFPFLPHWTPGSDASSWHRQLKFNVGDTRPMDQRTVYPSDVFRDYFVSTTRYTDYYEKLISEFLRDRHGYVEYQAKNRPERRTNAGCDTSQTGANMFLFAYDWRNSNAQSASELFDFVQCIRRITPGGNTAAFKFQILAHSNGGLVARRYILDGYYGTQQNYEPRVERMITLGTP
ncbi:MAG TPA: M23 family metallopeptidase, partial [Pyrinomonadaceae bacterium]|nr:M23 family metallopeptidase [Pyrinomonadaceae bacterium]